MHTHAVLLTHSLQASRVLTQPPALLRVPESCSECPWRQSRCGDQVLCLESRAESPVKAVAGGISCVCEPPDMNMNLRCVFCFVTS